MVLVYRVNTHGIQYNLNVGHVDFKIVVDVMEFRLTFSSQIEFSYN
jgi:hypothetical protein